MTIIIIYSTTRKSIYSNHITQDRIGQRLIFMRDNDKRIEFVEGKMISSGYNELSELLRDLSVIEDINLDEMNKE